MMMLRTMYAAASLIYLLATQQVPAHAFQLQKLVGRSSRLDFTRQPSSSNHAGASVSDFSRTSPLALHHSRSSAGPLRKPFSPSRTPSQPRTTALHSVFIIERAVAFASVSATAKLLSSIGLGAWAAKTPNVLDASAVSALSRLTYWIFQPAFLLCSVGRTLYQASTGVEGGLPGRFLALMPLAALLQISLGAMVGALLTKFVSFADDEARDVRMCTAFANSGPLPLIFSDALFGGTPLQAQVTACVSFYLLAWSPLFWSFGRVILGTYGDDTTSTNGARVPLSLFGKMVKEVRNILSPPVIGSILGVVIGGVPIMQRLFFQKGLLSPLYGAMATLGTAYLPAALLVLAGSLIRSKAKKPLAIVASDNLDDVSVISKTTPSAKAISSIFFSRFVLAPLLAMGILQTFVKLGLLGPVGTRARAVVSFCLLMEGCMPPAQNSVIMLQLEGLQDRAASMAKLLTILYSLAVVPVTILLSGCLTSSGILKV